MPVYRPDWVPEEHEINVIGPLVEQLDLSAIQRAYKGGGHSAYNPLMMVKILFYAYRLGVRSSRQIERMLYENIPMRVLSGNQQPDNVAPDAPHLLEIVDQVQENCGRLPDEMSLDAGYFSKANVELLEGRGIEAFIPPEKISHMHWWENRPPRGRIPKNLDLKGRMMRKLRTKWAKARYKLRETTVEPVIGRITWNRNLRQLPRRGLPATRATWMFECALHNLLKIAWATRSRAVAPAREQAPGRQRAAELQLRRARQLPSAYGLRHLATSPDPDPGPGSRTTNIRALAPISATTLAPFSLDTSITPHG